MKKCKNHIKTSTLILIWVLWTSTQISFAQEKKLQYDTLGNGAIKIFFYVFPSGELPSMTSNIEKNKRYIETYIVKDNVVLGGDIFYADSHNLILQMFVD